jgi:hypothetical protein
VSDTSPTAIIVPRTGGFNKRYDLWAESLVDPLEVMFRLALDSDPDVRFKAAATLLEHRHAKPKSAPPPPPINVGQVNSLVINMPPRPASLPAQRAAATIDVTPRDITLEEMLK